MMSDDLIKRINELWHKQKSTGLTDAEIAEQKQLREQYVKTTKDQVKEMLKGIKPIKSDAKASHHNHCSCDHCKH